MDRIEMENGERQQWLLWVGGTIRRHRHGCLVLHSDLEYWDYAPGGVGPPAPKPWVWIVPEWGMTLCSFLTRTHAFNQVNVMSDR